MSGWFRGTIDSEVSFCSGLCNGSEQRDFANKMAQSYPWICNQAGRLHENHSLDKFDAARFDACWSRIPSPKNILLDCRHFPPYAFIGRIVDAAIFKVRIQLP